MEAIHKMNDRELLERRLKGHLDKNSIVIFKEKHSDRYFAIPDIDTFCKVALKIVTERFKEGWYGDESDYSIDEPGLSREQVEALPEGKIKHDAMKRIADYEAELKGKARYLVDYKTSKRVVKEKDAPGALMFLLQRGKSGEYESWDIQGLESPNY
jgi:hypothetical protein